MLLLLTQKDCADRKLVTMLAEHMKKYSCYKNISYIEVLKNIIVS